MYEEWTRRELLKRGAMLLATATVPARLLHAAESLRFKTDPFTLGVASGYPSPTSVVLWTRLAPEPFHPTGGISASEVVPVTCEIATDERMRNVVRTERLYATARYAFSIHYEPEGLSPAHDYWYRFSAGGFRSVVGRTRTAPALNAEHARLKIAVASCQQFEHGYFHAYRHMLADDLDLIVHVGDYIYESSWGSPAVRHHKIPECVSLEDYRLQYALYRSDPDLQAAHAQYPWLLTWDDHEVENDYAGEMSLTDDPRAWFLARRAAAYAAYYEHMPLPRRALPHGADLRLFNRRAFGTLATLYMIDSRQYRSPLACTRPFWRGARMVNCSELHDPQRTKLGEAQESWLRERFAISETQWNLLAQGTLMAYLNEGTKDEPLFRNDSWNGYHAARERMMAALVETRVANPVVLSGDIHAFLVANLHRNPADAESPLVASELVATSISSHGGAQSKWDAAQAQKPQRAVYELADTRVFAARRAPRSLACGSRRARLSCRCAFGRQGRALVYRGSRATGSAARVGRPFRSHCGAREWRASRARCRMRARFIS
jgi:alkaline phosphatase D